MNNSVKVVRYSPFLTIKLTPKKMRLCNCHLNKTSRGSWAKLSISSRSYNKFRKKMLSYSLRCSKVSNRTQVRSKTIQSYRTPITTYFSTNTEIFKTSSRINVRLKASCFKKMLLRNKRRRKTSIRSRPSLLKRISSRSKSTLRSMTWSRSISRLGSWSNN